MCRQSEQFDHHPAVVTILGHLHVMFVVAAEIHTGQEHATRLKLSRPLPNVDETLKLAFTISNLTLDAGGECPCPLAETHPFFPFLCESSTTPGLQRGIEPRLRYAAPRAELPGRAVKKVDETTP